MAGGVGSDVVLDDQRVRPSEKIWRLIFSHWFIADPNIPNSPRMLQEQAFSGDVSIVRVLPHMTEQFVDSVYSGKFKGCGILELNADDVRKAGLVFEYDHDPEWRQDTHFVLRRVGGTVQQPQLQKKLNSTQKAELVRLACAQPLRREPP